MRAAWCCWSPWARRRGGGGAAPIHTIHVSQRGRLGHTVIRHTDFQVPVLGAVAPYPAVREALARRTSGITVLHAHGARVAARDRAGVVAGGRRVRKRAVPWRSCPMAPRWGNCAASTARMPC